MKKILYLLLAMLLLLTSCIAKPHRSIPPLNHSYVQNESTSINVPASESVPETSVLEKTDMNWQDLYIQFLLHSGSAFKTDVSSINMLCLYDLTFDGVPELIISDSAASAAYSFGIYQIVKNKVTPVWGYSALTQSDYGDSCCYSRFEDDWLTCRKEIESGEHRFVFITGNGSSDNSFGAVYSSGANEDGTLQMAEDFYFDDYWQESEPDKYRVAGSMVSAQEYENAYNEYFNIWEDTGYHGVYMLSDVLFNDISSPQKTPMNLTESGLAEFFKLYKPVF